jgi:hypothetical protein
MKIDKDNWDFRDFRDFRDNRDNKVEIRTHSKKRGKTCEAKRTGKFNVR